MIFSLQNLPIRRRLMLMILLTSMVVMLLMRGAFFTYEYLQFRRTTERHLATLGEIIAANSAAALAFDNAGDAATVLSALQRERHVVAAALYDRRGRLFSAYPATRPAAELPPAPGADGYNFSTSRLTGFQPVMQDGRPLGTLYLEYDTGTVLREWAVDALVLTGLVTAVVLLIAYALSRALQRQISTPILALEQAARAVSEQGDYSVRATKFGHDELGRLTDAFNQMLGQIGAQKTALDRNASELERRVAERTAQLEAANKELEAFSYSVSHDLRAPLRHVDGYANLVAKSEAASLSEKGRRYLGEVSASARQMGTLIDDLLVFSRMGRGEMKSAPVDLQQLAEETIATLKAENPARNIRWSCGPLPVVQGDRPMLRQVFVNLLANAVKYSGPRDPAEITLQSSPDPAGGIVVSIHDNGVGFEMEYAHKLFGVFQRLHRAEEFEGTGIGLANVRRIITRHGGRTWAEGRPGEGATFYFSLPQSQTEKS